MNNEELNNVETEQNDPVTVPEEEKTNEGLENNETQSGETQAESAQDVGSDESPEEKPVEVNDQVSEETKEEDAPKAEEVETPSEEPKEEVAEVPAEEVKAEAAPAEETKAEEAAPAAEPADEAKSEEKAAEAKAEKEKADPKKAAAEARKQKLDALFEELRPLKESGEQIDVKITARIRGGLRAMYKDVQLFLPASHFTLRRNPLESELKESVGKEFKVLVHELQEDEQGRKTIIISRKKILEEDFWTQIKVRNSADNIIM